MSIATLVAQALSRLEMKNDKLIKQLTEYAAGSRGSQGAKDAGKDSGVRIDPAGFVKWAQCDLGLGMAPKEGLVEFFEALRRESGDAAAPSNGPRGAAVKVAAVARWLLDFSLREAEAAKQLRAAHTALKKRARALQKKVEEDDEAERCKMEAEAEEAERAAAAAAAEAERVAKEAEEARAVKEAKKAQKAKEFDQKVEERRQRQLQEKASQWQLSA